MRILRADHLPDMVKPQKTLVRLHLDVHFHDSLLVSFAFMFETLCPLAKSGLGSVEGSGRSDKAARTPFASSGPAV